MKFVNVVRGTLAEKPHEVPGQFGPDGKPFVVVMRPLGGGQHEQALILARERAAAKGVKDPKIGEPIYDLALMAAVLLLGCVDPDSPLNARTRSFESIDQILGPEDKPEEGLHPEDVVYLHELHEAWQDEVSPTRKRLDENDIEKMVLEVADAGGQAAFMRMSPSTRLLFATFTARLASSVLRSKYGSFASGSDSTTRPPTEGDDLDPGRGTGSDPNPEVPEASGESPVEAPGSPVEAVSPPEGPR